MPVFIASAFFVAGAVRETRVVLMAVRPFSGVFNELNRNAM
jgi:hypothetical protein